MGHRSYLYLRTPQENDCLFEANNSLPVFWIGLLDEEMLHRHKSDWLTIEKAYDDPDAEEPDDAALPSSELLISPAQFGNNARDMQRFLQTHYPGALQLFEDFRNYLADLIKQTNEGISLDIIAFSNFTSVTELLDYLSKIIQGIKQNDAAIAGLGYWTDDLIGNGSGFSVAGFDSGSYQAAMRSRDRIRPSAPPPRQQTGPRNTWFYIVMLLLCPIFTFAVYRGYRKEGLSMMVVLVAGINIVCYLIAIYGIVQGIRPGGNQK